MRRDGTASGWPAGCGRAASRPSHPRRERGGLARASAGEDRPAGYQSVETRLSGLAAGRARPLHNGGGPDARGRRRPAAEPGAQGAGRGTHPHHQPHEEWLARLCIRSFKPHLRKASERLAGLRTPEGVGLPPNTLVELRHDMARLQLVIEQITELERARLQRLRQPPADAGQAQIALLARVFGLGIETADVVVHELVVRNLRDRRAVARYGGITGAPDESGARRREKGLARAGNARIRRIMLQLAWRFLRFQKQSALVKWFHTRTADGRMATRKTMILALARKLLVALWRLATTGEVPQGVVLRPAG